MTLKDVTGLIKVYKDVTPFMTDYRVGGRGKTAPWGDTVPVRIPVGLKDLVGQLFAGYRQVYGTYREKIYLDSVQKTIVGSLGLSTENKATLEASDLAEQVEDLQRKLEASQAAVDALDKKLVTIQETVNSYQGKAVKSQPRWHYALRLIGELQNIF